MCKFAKQILQFLHKKRQKNDIEKCRKNNIVLHISKKSSKFAAIFDNTSKLKQLFC